ncbi:MAG: FAD-dependent oxidoreductase [Chloroflexi bacterium]|nr:FAD-dependent oxidoreductase [Chloroflexota bacterium]
MARYPKLFEAGRIGTMELKNRLVMAPMGSHAWDAEGNITDRMIDYYVERAKGGVGFIITCSSSILPESRADRVANYDDKFIPGLSRMARAIQEHGAKAAMQVVHHGRLLSYLRQQVLRPEEIDVVGASPVPNTSDGMAPREASQGDIAHIVQGYAEAARRIKDAGYDAVEIHGGHGYLITQFLSPLTNKRSDGYGGTVEKRARFACEVISAVRGKVGARFPVSFRLSGSDFLPAGITIEDTVRQAPMFVEARADALHISASARESTPWQFACYLFPDGLIVHLAEAIKKVVRVPVITVGKINDPGLAERILQEGKADFIAMGRALLADPYLPNKAREGQVDEIQRCIYCNNCLILEGKPPVDMPKGRRCTVNPSLCREKEFALKPTGKAKRVMVIGGGLAGMEAARTAAQRGHQVSLYEKDDDFGGQWKIASQQDSKEIYATLTASLQRGLDKAGVRVYLKTEVTPEFVVKESPDAVVVATGATPRRLDVPGADGKNVVQASDVIANKAAVGGSVVVVGGRAVGMETALALAKRGKKVSLVTMYRLGENGAQQGSEFQAGGGGHSRRMERNIFLRLRDELIEYGVRVYPDSPVREITENGVYVVSDRELMFLKADTVVLAVGACPQNRLAEELKGKVPELYAIGDCREPRDARAATSEGAEVGRQV